jgi:hypothetical protein
MDIGAKCKYPASSLSNFAGHRFVLDDVEIWSMEGFLQSLKFKDANVQAEVCKLIGFAAKKRGRNKNWQQYQTLYWQGVEYKRKSKESQELLDRAYFAMFSQSDSFRRALKTSGKATLTHSIGRNKQSETVLTVKEFCSRLHKLREYGPQI